jgi:hypothetical protein
MSKIPTRNSILPRQRARGGRPSNSAKRAAELELHGMTIFEPARCLAKRFQEPAADARQLRDKNLRFYWSTFSSEMGANDSGRAQQGKTGWRSGLNA